MKNRALNLTAIIFFLLVNTVYFWDAQLGMLAFPAYLLLVLVYFGLFIALLQQLYRASKEKFRLRSRNLSLGLLILVLALTYYRPFGLINYDKLEGENLLIAEREGVASCMTTLKLKDNKTFKMQSVCFGISEVRGTYRVVQDTIYFDTIDPGRPEDEFFQFGVIRPSIPGSSKVKGTVILYKDIKDTLGYDLFVFKNELNKLKLKKQGR